MAESDRVKYWELIADNLEKADWSLGWVSSVDTPAPVTSFPPYRCHCDRCESYRSEPRHII